MKKLMIAASVAACAVAGFALESANIVGYQNRSMMDTEGRLMESYSGGPVFKSVGTVGNIYTLNHFGAKGMDVTADGIQFLDPSTTETYLTATYASPDDYAAGWVGWWDYDDVGSSRLDGNDADEFPACTAFLGLFASGNEIIFTFTGEVEKGTKEVSMTTESPFICNPQPKDLTLANVTADGMDVSADGFQFLDPFSTETLLTGTYANENDYGAGWKGWWDYDDLGVTRIDDTELLSGQGLLGMIVSGNEVTLTFDAVISE